MEYKENDTDTPNCHMVKEDHQEGIKRKIQKQHNPKDYEGHFGSMEGGWKHGKSEMSHRSNGPDRFKRTGAPLTPRKA